MSRIQEIGKHLRKRQLRCQVRSSYGHCLTLDETAQKFSISQALLLRVTIVKARFPSSGEVSGVSKRLLVAHNSKLVPLYCMLSIQAQRKDVQLQRKSL